MAGVVDSDGMWSGGIDEMDYKGLQSTVYRSSQYVLPNLYRSQSSRWPVSWLMLGFVEVEGWPSPFASGMYCAASL